jgi:predicted nicotinamide N-methyase
MNAPLDARATRLVAGWRRRLARRRALKDLEVPVPGAPQPLRITVPADPDGVLDEMTTPEPHMPYWATPWPSGLAMAEQGLERRAELAGRKVLELGCGLGTTATALALAGAELAVSDCFPETLAFCQLNVLQNTGRAVTPVLADWRTREGREALGVMGRGRLVIAADVLYEKEDVEPLMELIGALAGGDGEFWLAEPGRATSTAFVERAISAGWGVETRELERDWPAGAGYARVRLHTFRPTTH